MIIHIKYTRTTGLWCNVHIGPDAFQGLLLLLQAVETVINIAQALGLI